MTNNAKGEFDVKLVPLEDNRKIPLFGRMTNNKEFHGDLVGTSQGQMLAATTDVPNSAAYVSIERIEGTLNGHRGSFFLQHNGIMDRGTPSQAITVVPDSGTDELKGLRGVFNITIDDGKHYYEFEYSLPD